MCAYCIQHQADDHRHEISQKSVRPTSAQVLHFPCSSRSDSSNSTHALLPLAGKLVLNNVKLFTKQYSSQDQTVLSTSVKIQSKVVKIYCANIKHHLPAAILCSSLSQVTSLVYIACALLSYPKATTIGKTHGLVPTTALLEYSLLSVI
jgi:hypothetical protein